MDGNNEYGLIVPPNAVEAEQSVLGALMLAPEALAKIDDWLDEGDFYRPDHRMIYRAVRELAGRNQACDPVTLSEWFENNGLADRVGGPAYFLELANGTPSAANIVAYAEIVAEKSRLREAMRIGGELMAAARERHADSSKILAKGMHDLSQMQPAGSRGGLVHVLGTLRNVFASMVARYQQGPGLIGLETPWQALNAWTKGLRPILYVVAARPSMGKSVFGGNLADFVSQRGKRVGYFSIEMSADECMQRSLAATGDIPFEWIEQPNDEHEDSDLFWNRLTAANDVISKSGLLIDDSTALKRGQLRARALRAHRQQKLDLIVVDHLHDMGEEDNEEKRIAVGRNVQAAKDLVKLCRCPVVLLAQLNRNVAERADKRPTLSDLRETGEIEQKADVVLFLHREDYYDKNTHLKGVIELIPGKGRNLRMSQTMHLENHFARMRMTDMTYPLPEPEVEQGKSSWGRKRRFS